ncbi:MAG: PorT family protein [Proteobacteria bacterium]|nr:PorT family protein [Pseudomonadota bacterium]
MRKVFGLVCAMMFIAGISSVARAQDLSFGWKAGLNMANLTDAGEGVSYKAKTGIALGGFAVFKVNDNLSIQPEFLYTQKGNKIEYSYEDLVGFDALWNPIYETVTEKFKVKLDYIEIPVLVKYSFSPGESTCPFIFAGPALGILMSAKADSTNIKSDCNSLDIGLVLGGGVELESGVSIDLRYDMGMTKVFDFEGGDNKEKNTVISLMVGYKL